MKNPFALQDYIIRQGGTVEIDEEDITWYFIHKDEYGVDGYCVAFDTEGVWWGTWYKGSLEDGWIISINGIWRVQNFTYEKLI